ncbi:MAG: RluA family pseudouridine synthase [Hyphomicrobiaceae bacterium]
MTATMEQQHTAVVGPDHAGQRLDRVLAASLSQFSRARLQGLIKAGAVRVGDAVVSDGSRKVREGEILEVQVPEAVAAEPEGEVIPLTIVFEDAHLLVIDKPAGLVVHPGSGNPTGTLVNALIAHCGDSLSGIGGVKRPGIVHRLDKDTSGLLVVAKTDAAHAGLSQQFAAHGLDGRLQREYIALVWGAFDQPKGSIDAPVGRSATHRTRMAVVKPAFGRHAVTHYLVEQEFGGLASLMRLQLETGRTHQIRVHMAHAGHPLLGDLVYGAGFVTRRVKLAAVAATALDDLGRQALHAATLGFEHPVTGKKLHFASEPSADLARLIDALRRS